jgi:trigger factor
MQLVTEENGEVHGGDQVICDYTVKVDNKEVHQDEEIAVWVSGGMVADISTPELLVALKGAKAGEKREAAVNLGTKFRLAEYRGKEATLEVIIREIKRPKAPEINDELAKQFGVSSLEELRKNVQKSLEKDKGRWVEQDIQAQIQQKLVDMADFELPADLVAVQADEKVYRYKMEQLQRGVPMEHLDEEAEKLKQASQDSVKRDIKLSLVTDDIAEKEKIYVTEQEVEKKIQEIAAAYQMTPAKMRRELEKHESLPGIRQQMKEAKVLDFIQKEAQIENEKKKETQKTESKKGKKKKQETEGTEEKQKVG